MAESHFSDRYEANIYPLLVADVRHVTRALFLGNFLLE